MNLQKSIFTGLPILASIMALLLLDSCAVNTAKKVDPNDPWQSWNKSTQSFNDSFDKHILKPIALKYLDVTTSTVDQGVTNFFSNINDIGVSINDIFQMKFLNSGMDLSRFVINTTIGVAGIFDVASEIDLPKHNEDFGQTLGVWGVPSGPYLVLPFIGPSNPRETAGLIGDALLNPLTYVSIFGGFAGSVSTTGSSILNVTDDRANLLSAEKVLNEGANGNRYDFIKSSYLQHRQYLIYDGNPPDTNDPLDSSDNDADGYNNGAGRNIDSTKGKKAVVEVKPIQAR